MGVMNLAFWNFSIKRLKVVGITLSFKFYLVFGLITRSYDRAFKMKQRLNDFPLLPTFCSPSSLFLASSTLPSVTFLVETSCAHKGVLLCPLKFCPRLYQRCVRENLISFKRGKGKTPQGTEIPTSRSVFVRVGRHTVQLQKRNTLWREQWKGDSLSCPLCPRPCLRNCQSDLEGEVLASQFWPEKVVRMVATSEAVVLRTGSRPVSESTRSELAS